MVFDYKYTIGSNKLPASLLEWGNDDFWVKLEEAELLIRPLVDASFLMQRESNTLADVLMMLVNIYKGILEFHGDIVEFHGADYVNSTPETEREDIRKRWCSCKQPLFVLAFALHPKYRKSVLKILELLEAWAGKWKNSNNPLTAWRLADAALFYYCKHDLWFAPEADPLDRKKEEQDLKLAIYMWLSDRTQWNELYVYNPKRWADPCDWFDINKDNLGAPLVNFAKFQLDCPVQSALCERLFKDFSQFLSKHRSRLLKKKLVQSAMIKYDMKHKYPEDLAGNTGSTAKKNLHKNQFVKPNKYP
mgnify:CR=1 FL=1